MTALCSNSRRRQFLSTEIFGIFIPAINHPSTCHRHGAISRHPDTTCPTVKPSLHLSQARCHLPPSGSYLSNSQTIPPPVTCMVPSPAIGNLPVQQLNHSTTCRGQGLSPADQILFVKEPNLHPLVGYREFLPHPEPTCLTAKLSPHMSQARCTVTPSAVKTKLTSTYHRHVCHLNPVCQTAKPSLHLSQAWCHLPPSGSYLSNS
jgi:hypothetical protein